MSASIRDYPKTPLARRKAESAIYAKTIGVVTVGAGTQVEQHARGVPDAVPALDQVGHEQTFYRLTKIRASHPARVALLRVLREDVTVADVRRLWYARVLRFDGQGFALEPSRVRLQLALNALQMLAASVVPVLCYWTGHIGPALATMVLCTVWGSWAAYHASSIRVRYVYPIARLAKVLDRINADVRGGDGHDG
jgi:hypothetical protein